MEPIIVAKRSAFASVQVVEVQPLWTLGLAEADGYVRHWL